MKRAGSLVVKVGLLALALGGCSETLDAGSDTPSDSGADLGGGLPFDASSRVVLNNDGPVDNWQGEYALLLAATGLDLAAIIINDSIVWDDLASNMSGWQEMRDAAVASGIQGLPELTASDGPPLTRPPSGEIDDTVPNQSQGAQLIVQEALALDTTDPPLVVVAGGRLTDMADAYLVEPGIAERIVVVASLGEQDGDGALMGIPNGEMDPWANEIVVQRLRYVQVSGRYEQRDSVPASRVADLPDNAFGEWIAQKREGIWEAIASDQVALLTVAFEDFPRGVVRVQQSGTATLDSGETPRLVLEPEGSDWLVTDVDGDLASRSLWDLLDAAF